ncbi:MAG: tRNA1(Val) (adenine(37)-N6)-methyltransferase [Candidatus Aminicenantaceae bacterium]
MKTEKGNKKDDESLDTFYLGQIYIIQKKKGYRFSVDAPILADFIRTTSSDEIIELGTGNGIISLLLSIKPFKHITALEIQESLADLAVRNVILNNLEEKISVHCCDFCTYQPRKKFDIVFSNPPYIKKHEGRLSPFSEKSVAKHELKCDILSLMRKTGELLREKGRAYFIFPARRKEEFEQAASDHGLKVNKIRYVKNKKNSPPDLFLSECGFSSKKKTLLPPLVLYDNKGNYSSEALEIFSGRFNG